MKNPVEVRCRIDLPIEIVWKIWTLPEHIVRWNHASDDWHTTHAENNLIINGKFSYRMESKDGEFGFDFSGTYTRIEANKRIECILDDGRLMAISFTEKGNKTFITEEFEPEDENSVELQQFGWQAILNNFKKYSEKIYNDGKNKHLFEFSASN